MSSPSSDGARRWFWPTAVTLLTYLCAVQIFSALQESNIVDEPPEITAGYSYWKWGDFRMNPEHPPLAKMLAALPLLRFRLSFPTEPTSLSRTDEYTFASWFFEANAQKADALLFAARLTSIFLTACLGLAIALWARSAFNPAAALLALTLYAFDPTITALGRYVKNDVAITLFAFLACIAWGAYLTRPSLPRFLQTGLALGAALATKFSALFLFPVFLILAAIRYWQGGRERPLSWSAGSWLGVVSLSIGVVWLVYALPAFTHCVKLGGIDRRVLHDLMDRNTAPAIARYSRGGGPGHPFFEGLILALDHNTFGHPSYLLGMRGMKGWWYYFPVAFAVKMPAATLVFFAVSGWACLARIRRVRFASIAFSWFVLAVPPVVFGTLSLMSHLDIGIRHLLPIWPFLFILSAAIFDRARFRYSRAILVVLGAGLAAESVSIYPHYTAFFNVFAGGPSRGPKILVDSNIDWGQDAKNLSAWLRARGDPAPKVCVDYFGTADLRRLGISGPSLPVKWEAERSVSLDCIAAVSVTRLYGVGEDPRNYAWLRSIPPNARIGYSIYVYDLPELASLGQLPILSATASPAFRYVLHQDRRGEPTFGDPARPGEILLFFMTGLGPVTPLVTVGQPAPTSPLSYAELPLFCQWNPSEHGPFADVQFAGLAPGQVGLYQANVRVPSNLYSGPSRRSAQLTCSSGLFSGGQSTTASIVVPAGGP
jgi:hypothetical protein